MKLHKNFKDHDSIVNHLNKQEKSWTAASHSKFAGKSFAELNKMAGRRKAFGVEYKNQERPSLKNSFAQT